MEDRAARPFVTQASAYLRAQVLASWHRDHILTYGLRCPAQKKPTATNFTACRPYLRGIIDEHQPERILCFGAEACSSVVGRGFLHSDIRRGVAWTAAGVPVFLFGSVVGVHTNRHRMDQYSDDIAWALTAQLSELWKPPTAGLALQVQSTEDAHAAIDELSLAQYISVDVETFGRVGNEEFRVLSLSMTPEGEDLAYVLNADALDDPKVLGPVLNHLEFTKQLLGGHHFKTEQLALRWQFGVDLSIGWDTLLFRRLLRADAAASLALCQFQVGCAGGKDEAHGWVNRGSAVLRKIVKSRAAPKTKARKAKAVLAGEDEESILGLPPYERDVLLDHAVTQLQLDEDPKAFSYCAIPGDTLTQYNAIDTVSTERLRGHLQAELDARPGIKNVWNTTVRGLADAAAAMEFNGIAADRGAIAAIQGEMAVRVAAARQTLESYDADVNWNHAPSVLPVLQRLTGKQLRNTAADALAKINHPAVGALLEYRKTSRFKAQYADGMERFIRGDGRIHPHFQIAGTATGRPSCAEPNLLNIPSGKTDSGKACRKVFVAPPGKLLMEADYSQIELRVAAMLSGDKLMIDMFKAGCDFHLETAKLIAPLFGLKPEDIDADHVLRLRSKTIVFATLYGDTEAGLAAKLGISRQEAAKLQAAILGKYKDLKAWIQERLNFTRKHGYAPTWWAGKMPYRTRPLLDVASSIDEFRLTAERSSWNTPVQGTAAEFTNASLGELHRRIKGGAFPPGTKLVLTVYDSIILEVPEDEVAVVAAGVVEVMESWESLDVPIVADVEVGPNWGALEHYAA